MARSLWTGSISFGLLNVPVKLYSAVSNQSISFRELRRSDGSRVRHKRVAENDGAEIGYDDIVKGYEIAPEQYVVIDRAELSALDPKKTKTIEIEDFVDLDQIDPIYFNHPYYLGPDKGAERAYGLLAQAMGEQRKVAIARFVMRNKESLAAIRAADGVLTLATMRFADEVVAPAGLDGLLGEAVDAKPKLKEIAMAKALIDSLSADFDPTAYRDEYRAALLEMIEQKARGEEILSAEADLPKPTQAPDLMAALEQSLAAVKASDLGGGGRRSTAGKPPMPAAKLGAATKPTARGAAKPTAKAAPKSRAAAAK